MTRFSTVFGIQVSPSSATVNVTNEFSVTVPAAQINSNLTQFAFPVDLSNAPASFWQTAKVGGVNIRAFDSSGVTRLPCHVQSISISEKRGILWLVSDVSSSVDTVITLRLTNDIDLPAINSTYGSKAVFSASNYEVAVLGGPKTMNLGTGPALVGGGAYWQGLATLGTSPDTNIHEDFIYDEAGDRWWGVDSSTLYHTTDPFGGAYSAISFSTTLLADITTLLADGNTYTDWNGGFYNPSDNLLYVGFYGNGGNVNGIARIHPTTLALVGAEVTAPVASAPFQGADYCLFGTDKVAAMEYNPAGSTRLWIATLTTPHTLLHTLTLDTPIYSAQGVFWWPKEQCFIVSAATKALYRVDPDIPNNTGIVSLINYNPVLTTQEGVSGTDEKWITQLNVEDRVFKHDEQNVGNVGASGGSSWYLGEAFMSTTLSPALSNTFWTYVRAVQDTTANKYHLSLQQSGGSRVSVYHNNGNPRLETSFGMSPIVSTGGTANGVPNSWCIRYDNGSAEFYKDGVSMGTGSDTPVNLTTLVCGKSTTGNSINPYSHYSCLLLSRDAKTTDWLTALDTAISTNTSFCSITEK